MSYTVLKSLHIIFVVSWFAGLFYLPRLLVYHVEAQDKAEPEKSILAKQFEKMQKQMREQEERHAEMARKQEEQCNTLNQK